MEGEAKGRSMLFSGSPENSGGHEQHGTVAAGGGAVVGPVSTASAPVGPTVLPYASAVEEKQHRSRGRPPGSGKRQLLATLGEWFAYSAGGNFTPHVITIAAGEDVAARIRSFSLKGPRGICILSANGAISNVTLRQPGSSGGTLTFEGRFEILSLTGSFTITESNGARSRTGGISISLAGPDGRVIGGGVTGLLLAASPIQVVVASFIPNTFKDYKKRIGHVEPPNFSPNPASSGALTAARPISQANPHDRCDMITPTSTLQDKDHYEEESSVMTNPNPSLTSFHNHTTTGGWHGLQESSSEHKSSPDINLSLPGDI